MPPLPLAILTVPVGRVIIDTASTKYHVVTYIEGVCGQAVHNMLHILQSALWACKVAEKL